METDRPGLYRGNGELRWGDGRMPQKRRKHSKLLAKYIKINFCVIFLPVVLGCVLYCTSIQRNYIDKYLKTIEYSVNEKLWQLEARTRSFASTAQQICLEEDFTPYRLTNSSYSSINALKRLKAFTAESVYFRDLVIHLNDSDQVYTSMGVVDVDTFLDRTYQLEEGFSREGFEKLLQSKRYYECTGEGQYISSGAFQYSVIACPLGKTEGSYYGTLLGIYENDWEEMFRTEKEEQDKRLVCVCTGTMEMLYTQMPESVREDLDLKKDLTEPLAELLRDWDSKGEYWRFRMKGVNYIGKIAHSDVNGWYVIDMVDESSIAGEILLLQLPMLIGMFLSMLLLTFFLSIVLSVYNYVPIQKLYHLFDKKERKGRDRQSQKGRNELMFLNEYIRKMLEEQDSMGEQLLASRKISRMELVGRLLKGGLDVGVPAVREQIADMGLRLDKPYMAAMVLKIPEDNIRDFERKLRNVYGDIRTEGFYLTEGIYKYYDAFLACTEDGEEIAKFAQWLMDWAGEESGLQIGIGNTYADVQSLKYSLMEAIIAVESREEDGIAFFSELAASRNEVFYCKPLESELKLKLVLAQGAAGELEEVLEELYRELLHIRQSGSDTVLAFLMNRIMAVLFEDSLSLEEGGGERYLQYTNLEEFFARLGEFCRAELERRQERKAAREDRRMRKILDFIDRNYMRQEMSLVLVAGEFDMTGPYLSKIFKGAVGKNFIEYITEKRLERAAELLVNTDAPVGEIVSLVGYSDAASFTRKFTRYFLISPGAYRKVEREKKGKQEKGGREDAGDCTVER